MNKKRFIVLCMGMLSSVFCMGQQQLSRWNDSQQELAASILEDKTLTVVDSMGHRLLSKGYNAGSGYSQVWIRDFNTFVETAMDVVPTDNVKEALKVFFLLQQKNGEIVDGYVLKKDFNWDDPDRYYSKNAPDHVGFKNTVETDQETSLIQAVKKYVDRTGDKGFLLEKVAGQTVYQHLKDAVNYLLKYKFNKQYGLLTGALTADWGDVENDSVNSVDIGPGSTVTIDVYDNAMAVIAFQDLESLAPVEKDRAMWKQLHDQFATNIRRYLWDTAHQKFIPHLYPEGKPKEVDFDENKIYYHGGTAIAIEAGLLTKDEIKQANQTMLNNAKASGMPSIGLTVYPTYPRNFFPGGMKAPFNYQNGGDWTWFGGRMIQQLIRNGFVAEAYQEMRPMLDRVIVNGDFYEWYGPGCKPQGSAAFKGSAGVLCKAIKMLRSWALEYK